MTARYDGSGSGAFFMGLVTGAALGAAAAVLWAPKAGSEMRQDLADGVGDLGQAAKDRWQDVTATAASAVQKGREAYDEARGTAQEAADLASRSADRVKGAVKDAARDVASSVASGQTGPDGGVRY